MFFVLGVHAAKNMYCCYYSCSGSARNAQSRMWHGGLERCRDMLLLSLPQLVLHVSKTPEKVTAGAAAAPSAVWRPHFSPGSAPAAGDHCSPAASALVKKTMQVSFLPMVPSGMGAIS